MMKNSDVDRVVINQGGWGGHEGITRPQIGGVGSGGSPQQRLAYLREAQATQGLTRRLPRRAKWKRELLDCHF